VEQESELVQSPESLWRDANYGGRLAIHEDLLSDDARIAGEPSLPVGVAEHNERLFAARFTFARRAAGQEPGGGDGPRLAGTLLPFTLGRAYVSPDEQA
jgi:hypothetical protein